MLDFLKQVLTLVFVALLVALGAGLFPFYAVQIPVGIALILVTVLVLRRVDVSCPASTFRRRACWCGKRFHSPSLSR